MSEWFHSRTFAIVLLLSWLPLAAYLFPLPTKAYAVETGKKVTHMMETSDIVGSKFRLMRKQVEDIYDFYSSPEELHPWMMLRWGSYAMVIMMGLIAALLTFFRHHFWKIAVITAAGCYLFFVIFYSGMYLPGKLDARGWLMMVTQLNEDWLLIYRELLFPTLQVVLAMLLFFVTDKHPSLEYGEESGLKPHY